MVKNSGLGDSAPEAIGGLVNNVDEVKLNEVDGDPEPPKSGPVDNDPDPIPGVVGNPDDPEDFDVEELKIELNAAVDALVDCVRTN